MIILVGPSASGKTEVAKLLAKVYGMKKVVTHTTRAKRTHEIDDVDYHFVSIDLFLELQQKGYFVETTNYNGHYYGTSKKEIGDQKCLIVDPNGLHAFQELHDPHIVTFRLLATEDTRFHRMLARGDHLENIHLRLEGDRNDFSDDSVGVVDYTINTEFMSIEEVAGEVYSLYQARLKAH